MARGEQGEASDAARERVSGRFRGAGDRSRRRRPLRGARHRARLRRPLAHPGPPARLPGARRALEGREHSRIADQHKGDGHMSSSETVSYSEKIQDVIDGSPVALFMKGTPEMIMCGNSERALGALRRAGAPIIAVDVLLDMRIREDLSAISGWPTIPQVFVKGELIGGADIVEEMERSGELEETLVDKLGENYWEARGEKTVTLT